VKSRSPENALAETEQGRVGRLAVQKRQLGPHQVEKMPVRAAVRPVQEGRGRRGDGGGGDGEPQPPIIRGESGQSRTRR